MFKFAVYFRKRDGSGSGPVRLDVDDRISIAGISIVRVQSQCKIQTVFFNIVINDLRCCRIGAAGNALLSGRWICRTIMIISNTGVSCNVDKSGLSPICGQHHAGGSAIIFKQRCVFINANCEKIIICGIFHNNIITKNFSAAAHPVCHFLLHLFSFFIEYEKSSVLILFLIECITSLKKMQEGSQANFRKTKRQIFSCGTL